jgi:hypothetical protein
LLKSKNPSAPAVRQEAEEDQFIALPKGRQQPADDGPQFELVVEDKEEGKEGSPSGRASGRCHHSVTINADHWPDELPVRSLCARMVCTRCGVVGAHVRPDWGAAYQQDLCVRARRAWTQRRRARIRNYCCVTKMLRHVRTDQRDADTPWPYVAVLRLSSCSSCARLLEADACQLK